MRGANAGDIPLERDRWLGVDGHLDDEGFAVCQRQMRHLVSECGCTALLKVRPGCRRRLARGRRVCASIMSRSEETVPMMLTSAWLVIVPASLVAVTVYSPAIGRRTVSVESPSSVVTVVDELPFVCGGTG